MRTLIRKIPKKNPPNKKEMPYILFQLLQDPEAQINEVESNIFSITGWSRIVDRGGLLHGTAEYTHSLVCFEKIILKNIRLEKGKCYKEWDERFPPETTKEVKANLHIHVVTEFVNLRGFAHVARWMEKFKYINKQKICK